MTVSVSVPITTVSACLSVNDRLRLSVRITTVSVPVCPQGTCVCRGRAWTWPRPSCRRPTSRSTRATTSTSTRAAAGSRATRSRTDRAPGARSESCGSRTSSSSKTCSVSEIAVGWNWMCVHPGRAKRLPTGDCFHYVVSSVHSCFMSYSLSEKLS